MNESPLHVLRVGPYEREAQAALGEPREYARHIEPWLSSLLQTEHVALLLGSGFTTAAALAADAPPTDMSPVRFDCDLEEEVNEAAAVLAQSGGRGQPNLEDQLTAALQLAAGLDIMKDQRASDWRRAIDGQITHLLRSVLATERGIEAAVAEERDDSRVLALLTSFLLTFASRSASRERLHVLTTNYDRLVEFAADLTGLRILDRFVGMVRPVYRSSRLEVDFHYNPPGIRGEPRYLEGVVRLTKLHGSIDWRRGRGGIIRDALPFGAEDTHPAASNGIATSLLIYPHYAKEFAASFHPYADLLRDFSASVCRPNSGLITFGYGFGDEHINRVIRDMLAIPSTHLVIMSWDDPGKRIEAFRKAVASDPQISLLLGSHFGSMEALVDYYLPKPAIDPITSRMNEMLRQRQVPDSPEPAEDTRAVDER